MTEAQYGEHCPSGNPARNRYSYNGEICWRKQTRSPLWELNEAKKLLQMNYR